MWGGGGGGGVGAKPNQPLREKKSTIWALLSSFTVFTFCVPVRVSVAEWPPSGKELLIQLTTFSLCIMSICYFGCLPFEPRYEETGFLHMRKQRRRSAAR